MNDDGIDPGSRDAEIVETLRAYAWTRLSPDPAAVARIRARVVREAELSLAPAPFSVASPEPTPLGRRRRPHRVVTALLAASLAVLAIAGGTLAARPGGPLYGARMWVESALLPSDPGGRVDSEIARLNERIAEAGTASAAGDEVAAAAAFDAYAKIVDDALGAAAGDTDLRARLELILGKHVAVLEALVAKVPGPAQDAIRQAIEKSDRAVERIRAGGRGTPGTPGTPGGHPATKPPKDPPAPTSRPTPGPTSNAAPSLKPTPNLPGKSGDPANASQAAAVPEVSASPGH